MRKNVGPALAAAFTLAAAVWPAESRRHDSSDAPAAPGTVKSWSSKTEIASSLDRVVPRLMKDGDVPGLSMAIVRDGKILWHWAFGVRDAATGVPVADDTVFEAASLSKPVFAYAVLKLADAGQLPLYPEPIDPARLLQDAAQALAPQNDARGTYCGGGPARNRFWS